MDSKGRFFPSFEVQTSTLMVFMCRVFCH